jgi:peroxiredoxin
MNLPRSLVSGFGASLLSIGLIAALPAQALDAGQIAPPFTLNDPAGKSVSLESLRGHYVYVDFWASWCGPCKQSFSWMNALQTRHAASGLQVVAINVDEKEADARRFLGEVPASFTVVFDPKGVAPGAYNVQGMPTSFLIGPDGKVLFVHQSFKDSDRKALDEKIAALIGAKP